MGERPRIFSNAVPLTPEGVLWCEAGNVQKGGNAETEAEALLWTRLRKNQLHGFRFKRQHPIADYIADFYCHEAKLVIEVDGKYHDAREQKLYDEIRTKVIISFGLRVSD